MSRASRTAEILAAAGLVPLQLEQERIRAGRDAARSTALASLLPALIQTGAGIAGATLALSLAQAGLRPVLIDPVVFDDQLAPTFDGRASAIAYSSFRQWRALGLAGDLEPYAERVKDLALPTAR